MNVIIEDVRYVRYFWITGRSVDVGRNTGRLERIVDIVCNAKKSLIINFNIMRKTQKEKIISLLKRRKWVTVQMLHDIAWRYGDILFKLRQAGYEMEKRRQKDCRLEEWHLIKQPKKII